MTTEHDLVLVVDFGAQYAQLIARRVREARVYSEVVPSSMPVAEMLAKGPKAIVLSGGPSSVYEPGAPQISDELFDAGVPVFGMCYGFQVMAQALGGEVKRTGRSEYGRTPVVVEEAGTLLAEVPESHKVWMSHGDSVVGAPAGFTVLASTVASPVAAFEHVERGFAGVQWHPEVMHTEHGQTVLAHFLHHIAGCRQTWTMVNIVEEQLERIRTQIGDAPRHLRTVRRGRLRGGRGPGAARRGGPADLRLRRPRPPAPGRGRAGRARLRRRHRCRPHVVDAQARFLDALAGVTDPEEKRKIIGREFIRVFEQAEIDIIGSAAAQGEKVQFLVQGTLYPDVVESGGGTGAANIKSHHNVGGLPDDLEFELVEPLRLLFKDEVRLVGEQLGLPAEIVWRHPFPGPGLGIRIIGEVTHERLEILRAADSIAREELTRAGLDRDIWQFPVVLLADVRSVGVQGDGRTYGHPIVLRPVTSRGRHDRRLGTAALRRRRDHLHTHHQRGARGQPGHHRRHQQAPRHHRVGVASRRSPFVRKASVANRRLRPWATCTWLSGLPANASSTCCVRMGSTVVCCARRRAAGRGSSSTTTGPRASSVRCWRRSSVTSSPCTRRSWAGRSSCAAPSARSASARHLTRRTRRRSPRGSSRWPAGPWTATCSSARSSANPPTSR